MTRWVRVAEVGDVPDGRGRAFSVGGLRIALFRDGQTWHAIDEACPHQGTSLAPAVLHDGRVICPLHAWVFDVRTGQCPRGTHEGVTVYPTRCEDGWVEVHAPSKGGRSE
ncbi:MAG: Rieske 2Fe-2S domain-containing protein [Acidobacteria bacterium]|nr:Rieske 2Fe-2S domain-containing protein [Acidobacteriota bacterium]NIQ86600.1 Rieske 2Fe-2S domain-containing protein [Acidobacteriota bacterium]